MGRFNIGPRARKDDRDELVVLTENGLDPLSDQLDELLAGARAEREREEAVITSSVESLERSAAELRQQVRALAESQQGARDLTSASLDSLRTDIDALRGELATIREEMSALQAQIERDVRENGSQVWARLHRVAEQTEEMRTALEAIVVPIGQRIDALTSDLASADARTVEQLEALRRGITADANNAVRALGERLDALTETSAAPRIDAVADAVAALRGDVAQLAVLASSIEEARLDAAARATETQAILRDELGRTSTQTEAALRDELTRIAVETHARVDERFAALNADLSTAIDERLASTGEDIAGRIGAVRNDVERMRAVTTQSLDALRRVTEEQVTAVTDRFGTALASLATSDQLAEMRAEIEYLRTLYGTSVEYLKAVFEKFNDDLDAKLTERFEWYSVESKARADDMESRLHAVTDEVASRTGALERLLADATARVEADVASTREDVASARSDIEAARAHTDAVVEELRRKIDQGIIETEASVARALGRFQHEESERAARVEQGLVAAQTRVQAAVGALEEQFARGIATLEARFTAYVEHRERALAEERARFVSLLDEALSRIDERDRKKIRKVFGKKRDRVEVEPVQLPEVELPEIEAPVWNEAEWAQPAPIWAEPEAVAAEPAEPIALGPVSEPAPKPRARRAPAAAKKTAAKKPAAKTKKK